MKNISWIVNGVLVVAVAVLFVLHFSDGDKDAGNHEEDQAQVLDQGSGELKVAYVFIDSLLANYKLAQELTEKLISNKEGLESELASKGEKLEKKIADFQYKVQKGLITSWDARETEKELNEEQQVFINLQNDMQGRLLRDEQDMNQQVYDAVMDYVAKYNKDYQYNLIISQSAGGVLLYAEGYMNITKEILAGLNAEHMAAK